MTSIKTLIVAAVCIIGGFTLGLLVNSPRVETKKVIPPVAVTVGKAVSPKEPVIVADLDNNLDPAEKIDAAKEADPSIHEDMRDETPPGVPQDAAKEIATDTHSAGIGKPIPVGGAQNYYCPRHLVRNFSSRASGTKVGLFVLHYTVSRPGSLNAIYRLFNTPAFGASSHLGLEPSGKCEQWVEWNNKAWTEGTFNSVSDSVEIMAMGSEPRSWWLQQPIIKDGILSSIVVDRLRARGIPPKRVDPIGCGVQQAGWTDHNALECGNTHHDVQPNFPYDVFGKQVIQRYNAGQATALPGPRPKPTWFWDACGEWIGGQFTGLSGPSPKPSWFWQACEKWNELH